MNLYEIKYYANVDHLSSIRDNIVELLQAEEQVTIKQSWENGYHLCLFGLMTEEKAHDMYAQLCEIQRQHPSPAYCAEEFQQRYQKVAMISHQQEFLEPVYQNQTMLTLKDDDHIFENDEQLKLYLYIHQILDKHLAMRYFAENSVLELIHLLKPFIDYLPEKVLNESASLVSSGYVSHLSHYVGLINSLNESDRTKIQGRFEARRQQDLPVYLEQCGRLPINELLLEDLISVYHLTSQYVEEGKLNFFSPKSFETDVKPHLHQYHDRHAQVLQSQEYVDKTMKDHVLCTNKWVLNVWYEKLVLLNIKPIDKFYMNYFLSRLKYDSVVLEVS